MTANRPENMPATIAASARLLAPAFGVTLMVSAALLFWTQPLVGKLALPVLGGSPSVWNTLLLFFQTALLAGYAYAHMLCRLKSFPW